MEIAFPYIDSMRRSSPLSLLAYVLCSFLKNTILSGCTIKHGKGVLEPSTPPCSQYYCHKFETAPLLFPFL